MSITIELPLEVETALRKKASGKGKDFQIFVVETLQTEALQPSLDEILAPFRREVDESGITDEELDALVEQAREEIYQEKSAKNREQD